MSGKDAMHSKHAWSTLLMPLKIMLNFCGTVNFFGGATTIALPNWVTPVAEPVPPIAADCQTKQKSVYMWVNKLFSYSNCF